MALRTILEKLEKLWKLGLLLMILVVLGSWLPEIASGLIGDHFDKGQGGIVIVDSPEVYSRERLINDRFRQVAWLEDELDQSPELTFGNQAISDLRHMMSLDTKIGIGGLADEDGEDRQQNRDNSAGSNGNAGRDASVSPSERFRDIRAYREEIRTEMMETLLDDRHDIKGNTLYRLKFDTTVLPEENTEKFAVIQVKLARAEFCKPGDPYLRHFSSSKHRPCISIEAIHKNWVKLTEEKINKAIEGTIRSFMSASLPDDQFAELVGYLQAELPNAVDSRNKKHDDKAKNLDDLDRHMIFQPACVGTARAEFPRKIGKDVDSNKNVDLNKSQREEKIRSCPRMRASAFFARGTDAQTRARFHNLRKLLLRYYDKHLNKTGAYEDFQRIHKKFTALNYDTLKGNKRSRSPLYEKIKQLIIDRGSGPQPDTNSVEKSVAEEIVEQTVAEEIVEQISGKLAIDFFKAARPQDKSDVQANGENETPEYKQAKRELYAEIASLAERKIEELISEMEVAEQLLLRYAVVNLWIDKYTYDNRVKIGKCRKLYANHLEVFEPESLSCIAHLEKTKSCIDVDYCTVSVEARLPEARRNVICDETVKEWDLYDWCIVRRVFERLLKIDETYYSYAVTPKESAQRVLTIASERRQKQLALSLIASSAKGLDAETVSSISRAISESASQMEQIQRKPLILSFGRGQPVVGDAVEHRGIDFGWVLGPKFLFSDRSKGEIKFRHAPVQNSLSAVISVPSWWTVVSLQVDTCWIDQQQLSQMKPTLVKGLGWGEDRKFIGGLCDEGLIDSSHNVDIDYLVRLPGSVEELPRKFGYEIERVPSLSSAGTLADFYVGQEKASLIIQGSELWRSTVVTMGHQKADSIEVLPNMKGIIATFRKIDIPREKIEYDPKGKRGGQPANCYVRSEIVVWTSEGRTPENQLFANIHANRPLGDESGAEKVDDAPKGFGACDDVTLQSSSINDTVLVRRAN